MTLHDVAARAGVSIGTVSNYLRGNVPTVTAADGMTRTVTLDEFEA